MAGQTMQTPVEPNHQASLDIPWMRLWEKKSERERASVREDLQTRLVNIDYMTMLEELEFR